MCIIVVSKLFLFYNLLKMPDRLNWHENLPEVDMDIIKHELFLLQDKLVRKGRQNVELELKRWLIKYDPEEKKIKSWWNEVEVTNIDGKFCQLEWLNLWLTLQEWLWLANFKNWLKHKYWNEKVVFKHDIKNKKLAFRKTLCVNDTMLITRSNLIKHIWLFEYDRNMETLADWLNN